MTRISYPNRKNPLLRFFGLLAITLAFTILAAPPNPALKR